MKSFWKCFVTLWWLFLLPLTAAWWFDETPEVPSEEPKSEEEDGEGKKLVPFEVMTVEQKFLQEAKELLNLSPLDKCQHKVVDSLHQSCGKLSEEGIAKLSVQLLNCQSQAEGREIYPCTKDMSIAQCTGPMDAHTWNAYHIVSNRARSVCYTIRQSQFRLQTESIVNRLSQSTVYQLRALEQLSMGQDEIRQSTLDSLNALKKEKEELSKRQNDLNTYQEKLKNSMEDNINQLVEEKSLINKGQAMIHNMTKSIKEQLGVAQKMLNDHETRRMEYQQEMSEELGKMRHNIREVWSNIDNSTVKLLEVVNQLNTQYQDMQSRLNSINSTVSHVLVLLDNVNHAINIQLGWLMDNLGGAQDGLYVLTSIATHGVFLLVTCLVLIFLKAPWFSRLMLLVMVVVNLVVDINTTKGLSLSQLVLLMGIILIGDAMFVHYCCKPLFKKIPSFTTPISPPPPPSTTNSSRHTIDISDDEVNDLLSDITENGGYVHNSTPVTNHIHSLSNGGGIEDFSYTSGKCIGVTRAGLPCKMIASPRSKYCFRHK